MNCPCGAHLEPNARFCGSCGAPAAADVPTILPRSVQSDPERAQELLRQAEMNVSREEEKVRGGDGPPPWNPPPEVRPYSSPATVYGTPQMMAHNAPPPPPPSWPGPPPPPSYAPPSPQHGPFVPAAPVYGAPAPVYGGPAPMWPLSPPGSTAGTPIRVLAIPVLGTLCGVGIGFALGHDLVPALIGGALAGAASVWHAARLG